jgi:hypothetical protein
MTVSLSRDALPLFQRFAGAGGFTGAELPAGALLSSSLGARVTDLAPSEQLHFKRPPALYLHFPGLWPLFIQAIAHSYSSWLLQSMPAKLDSAARAPNKTIATDKTIFIFNPSF